MYNCYNLGIIYGSGISTDYSNDNISNCYNIGIINSGVGIVNSNIPYVNCYSIEPIGSSNINSYEYTTWNDSSANSNLDTSNNAWVNIDISNNIPYRLPAFNDTIYTIYDINDNILSTPSNNPTYSTPYLTQIKIKPTNNLINNAIYKIIKEEYITDMNASISYITNEISSEFIFTPQDMGKYVIQIIADNTITYSINNITLNFGELIIHQNTVDTLIWPFYISNNMSVLLL